MVRTIKQSVAQVREIILAFEDKPVPGDKRIYLNGKTAILLAEIRKHCRNTKTALTAFEQQCGMSYNSLYKLGKCLTIRVVIFLKIAELMGMASVELLDRLVELSTSGCDDTDNAAQFAALIGAPPVEQPEQHMQLPPGAVLLMPFSDGHTLVLDQNNQSFKIVKGDVAAVEQ